MTTEGASANGPTTLLIIDPQNDFHPGGTLAIPTADSDAERIACFVRKHMDGIDQIVITLDSHQRVHIAHGIFWVNDAGEHPPPFTLISSEEIARGTWKAVDESKQEAAEEYARKLEERGKFKLCIWPEHCIIGSPGHNVRPVILAAVNEWAESRMKEVVFVWKGQNCLTEMYSALRAEVPVQSDERTLLNTGLLRTLKESSHLIVCGQALSHCVQFTVRDLVATYTDGPSVGLDGLDGIPSVDGLDGIPSVCNRVGSISLLRDCTSAVPGFEEVGDAFLADMKSMGLRIVTTDSCVL